MEQITLAKSDSHTHTNAPAWILSPFDNVQEKKCNRPILMRKNAKVAKI